MSETLKEKIVFEIETPKPAGGGLSALVDQLAAIDKYLGTINGKLAGLKVDAQFTRTFNQLQTEIKKLQSKQGGLGVENLAKGLGFDPEQVKRFFTQAKRELKGFTPSKMEFASAPTAAAGFNKFAAEQRKAAAAAADGLKNLLTPTIGQVNLAGLSATGKVEGVIPLTIPATQVQASIVGQITLAVPGSQVTGAGGGLPRDPATGKILPGGGGGGGRKAKGGKGPLEYPATPSELSRVITETEDSLRATITEATALGETVSKTYDSIEGELKTVTRTNAGQALKAELKNKRQQLEQGFKAEKAALKPGDHAGLAKLQQSQAKALEDILTAELKAVLGDKKYDDVAARIQGQATILKQQAQANAEKAAQKIVEQKRRDDIEQAARNNRASELRRARQEARDEAARRAEREKIDADVEAATRSNKARRLWRERQKEREERDPSRRPSDDAGKPGVFAQAFRAFTPAGFALNLIKVAGWAAAVGALYKTLELATYSMTRMLEIGEQTARLSQVFRGVGGNAQQLTQDIVDLASANGRSTEEAMEASVAWARLGLNRMQINEAVRVSLMAANVAEVDAGTATKYLSSIMAVYGLQVRDMNGVLGMLNNTSNEYNVTNRDLFEGIARSASVAKQAGMSLAELQGIIGAAVGRTGQTGSNIGNALKSVIVSLSTPDNQSYLREGLKVEPLGEKPGEMKGMPQLLREIYVAYQGLNDEERKSLTVRIAGRTQAARFVAIMDSYVQGQKLAIDSQLNLNSAQLENAKIMETQKAQLLGLRSAWDSFVVKQSNSPSLLLGGKSLNETLVTAEKFMKNMVNLANFRVGSDQRDDTREVIKETLTKPSLKAAGKYAWKAMMQPTMFMDVVNYMMESREEASADQMRKLSDREQAARKAASGYAQRGQLLRTVSAGLARGRPEENEEHVRGLLPGKSGDDLQSLVSQNRIMEAQKVLKEAAAAADAEAKKQVEEALLTKNEAIGELRIELSIQQSLADNAKDGSEAKAEALDRVKTLNGQINEFLEQRQHLLDNEDEVSGDFEGRTQAMVDLLQRQKSILENISALYQQMPIDTASGRLESRVSFLRDQEAELTRSIAELDASPGSSTSKIQDRMQLENQRREVRGERAALESPDSKALTQLQDNRSLAFRQAAEQAQSYGVGHTEAEKLLNREAQLKKELAGIKVERYAQDDMPAGWQDKQAAAADLRKKAAENEAKKKIWEDSVYDPAMTINSKGVVGTDNQPEPGKKRAEETKEHVKGEPYTFRLRRFDERVGESFDRQNDDRGKPRPIGQEEFEKIKRDAVSTYGRRADFRNSVAADWEKESQPLHKKGDYKTGSDNDAVRMMQFEVELARTREQIQTRIVFLKGQEKQIQMDANREFQKSLLFASPGELLKKMAVSKFAQGGMNAGQFFMMSPELRKEYDGMRGGEEGRRNREEQRRLRGREQSLPKQQMDRATATKRLAALGASLGEGQNHVRETARGMDLETRTKAAQAGIVALGKQAGMVALVLQHLGGAVSGAMKAIQQAVAGIPGGGGVVPGLNVDTGHALGSR